MDAQFLDDAGRRHGADIVAADRPGIGHSDTWTMRSFVEWSDVVDQLADSLAVGEFAVAGWSGGGPYALACAAAMPDRVRAVATVAGMAPLERVRHIFELGLWADKVLISAARLWAPGAGALLRVGRRAPDCVLAWQLSHLARSGDQAELGPEQSGLRIVFREAIGEGVRGMVDEYRRYYGAWGFDLDEVWQSVTIWQGEQDTLVPMSHADRLATALPNAVLRVVPSTGHLLPLLVADEIVEDLAP